MHSLSVTSRKQQSLDYKDLFHEQFQVYGLVTELIVNSKYKIISN